MFLEHPVIYVFAGNPFYLKNLRFVTSSYTHRYLGFKRTILLDRRNLVGLLDLYQNGTIPWDEFESSVRRVHKNRIGQPIHRRVIPDKPKEEDYFYANPQECLCGAPDCNDLLGSGLANSTIEV